MLIFSPDRRLSFPSYGIEIPSLDSRFEKTLEVLKTHPKLSENRESWLIEYIPSAIEKGDLYRAHEKKYVDSLYNEGLQEALIEAYELRDSGGQWNRYSPQRASNPLSGLLNDVLGLISGSWLALESALEKGFCYFLGGGMHHAHPAFGHGFCLLNDICIALLKARAEGRIQKAWVIDMDAHRGDGTAEILAPYPELISLSIHMAHGWPLDGPEYTDGVRNPGWYPGDVDIPLAAGDEGQYLPRLMDALKGTLFDDLPDLALVLGGADPYKKDELPSTKFMKLSKAQLLERDISVYHFLEDKNIPQVWLAAGGYGRYSWEIHSQFLEWVLVRRYG